MRTILVSVHGGCKPRGGSVRRFSPYCACLDGVKLDIATVLLQWSAGGLLFAWLTTRRRVLGVGYGWLLRGVYLVVAFSAGGLGRAFVPGGTAALLRDFGACTTGVVAAVALVVSVARRKRGGAPPVLDLAAATVGFLSLVAAAVSVGGPTPLALFRLVAGAAFLGGVTDAMLLGHWYLVQPGLGRGPIKDLLRVFVWIWPLEVAAMMWPTGMVQVFSGTIDDGWGGVLAYIWLACAISTIVLVGVTWLALKEPYYSAVMAATGLLYLAILTAFGTDLVARAVLTP